MNEEIKLVRDVLTLTPEQFEDVEEGIGWEAISEKHYDKRRWCDIWRYVVKNTETGKFYSYYGEVYSGDYESGDDSGSTTTMTEVFPHTVSTVVYK